jgi:Phosphodiester glycosidase
MTYPVNLPPRISKKNTQKSKKYFSRKSFLLHTTLGLLFAGSWFIPANVLKTGLQSLSGTVPFNGLDEGVLPTPTPTLATAKSAIPISPILESSILEHPLKLGSIGLPGQMAAVSQRPIRVTWQKRHGVRFYLATVDLTHPSVLLHIGLPQNAAQANSPKFTKGVEPFKRFVTRHPATVMVNGTFFSTDAQKRVMGNMVAGGRVLKYSPAENYGTTLGIRKGRRLELVTARTDGKPAWNQHWFSLTAGPRLLRQGRVWIAPRTEGFTDRRVMGVASRNAIGYSAQQNKLYIATFLTPITLKQEATIMKAIGCHEAMNLDGGSSTGLAHNGKILVNPRRSLTNVIAIHDLSHPAPLALRTSWQQFQGNLTAYSN